MASKGMHCKERSSADDPTLTGPILADIFNIVGIATVVVIDDAYGVNLEDVIAEGNSLEGKVDVPGGVIDFGSPVEVWRAKLTALWSAALEPERAATADAMWRAAGREGSPFPQLELLEDMMPENVRFLTLAPAGWVPAVKKVRNESAEDSLLIMFDKAFAETDPNGGLREIQRLLDELDTKNMWIALFTNTVRPDEENREAHEVAQFLGVPPSTVFVISKQHLTEQDCNTFLEALRVGLMARPAGILTRSVAETVATTLEDARTTLMDLTNLEFERLVFGLSREEGVWEVDMILRLFRAVQQAGIRMALYDDAKVQESINVLRALDGCRSETGTAASVQAQHVYQRELYEEPTHLNRMHLPLELGDIFKKERGEKHFVAVAQPCDMMVRKSGERSPEVDYVTLLPINQTLGEDPPRSRALFRLPAYLNSGESGWVELDRPVAVPIEVLDFCVLNREGRSRVFKYYDVPEGMLPNWQKRGTMLMHQAKGAVNDSRLTEKELVQKVRALYGIRKSGPIKPRQVGDGFTLGLQRIRRVLPPYSRALLTTYMIHKSRDAFERALI